MRRTMAGGLATAVLGAALAIIVGVAGPAWAAPFTDDFNRADSTDLGAGWTEVAGTSMAISGNRATNPDATAAMAQAVGGTGTVVEGDVTAGSSTNYVALVLDVSADLADNVFVKVQDSGGDGLFEDVYFYRGNNGDPGTDDYVVSVDPFAAGHMRLSRVGSDVRLTVNTDGDAGLEVDLTRTYTTLGTGTGVGFGIYSGATLDNFATSDPTSTTTISSSANPSIEGESVTFTATVAGASGTPTGSIVFTVDGTPGAPIAMSGGQASLSTNTLTEGDHTVSAAYTSDDPEWSDSTSAELTQTVEPPPRPDARIRRASQPLVGDDVYNDTGVGQTASGNGRARQVLVFTINVQNDGEVTEGILLHGQGSTNLFGVTYRDANGVNITRQVVDGTHRLRQVAPGTSRRVTASVLVRPAATPGLTLSRLVTATSLRSGEVTDVVRFVARRSA